MWKLIFLLMTILVAGKVHADFSSDQIRYASTGRYDLLEQITEQRASERHLTTADRHALCYAYSRVKRYSKLFECLDQLERSIQSGDKRTRLFGLHDATPTVLIMRAEAYIELAQFDEAQKIAANAVKWLEDDDTDDMDMLAAAYAAWSLSYSLSGNLERGREIERKLSALKLGWITGDYASAKAFSVAKARMGLKDYSGVIDVLRADRSFAFDVFLDRLISGSFLTGVNNWAWVELPRAFMLNKALREVGQLGEARSGFEKLLAIPAVRDNGDIYWPLLAELASIAESEGGLEKALEYYRRAADVIEIHRGSINTEASKIGFVGDKQAIYAAIVRLAGQAKRPDIALEAMERAKSRALVDLLASRDRESPVVSGRNAEDQQVLRDIRLAQERAQLQLPVDLASREPGSVRALAVQEISQKQAKAPELASLVAVNAISFSELEKTPGVDEALIEYFVFGNELHIAVVRGDQKRALNLPMGQLEADIRSFRQEIEDLAPYPSELAKRLYRQLIAPVADLIGKSNLLIVPHGALHYLPFAALHDGQGSLLSQRAIRVLPSGSVQKFLRTGERSKLAKMLILGNPDLGQAALDLPSAEIEAKVLADLVQGSTLVTRKAASESYFKTQAPQHVYLHIASHGQFRADDALGSRLLLASDQSNDGSLTVRELYGLRLNADLVTLSACETGLGKSLSGDDVVGLTRGFLYAGSSNVVASLWEVDDEATSLLMKSFYTKLAEGRSKKIALREAQIALAKSHPQPMFWAPFYLTGSGH
ncbi:MAG: CHAT domain-containing protein [Dechloromonas sp.]|nr:MAG: CHAT domain-containing protein [Dechloromonas sp.]